MNELIKPLTPVEREQIANEIEKLFLYQDRPVTDKKIALFVDEIALWNMPAGAIIMGVRSLCDGDMKAIKLSFIKEAASDFIVKSPNMASSCKWCDGAGTVIMVYGEHEYNTAFACFCHKGRDLSRSIGMAQWSGKEMQVVRGETYRLLFPDILTRD